MQISKITNLGLHKPKSLKCSCNWHSLLQLSPPGPGHQVGILESISSVRPSVPRHISETTQISLYLAWYAHVILCPKKFMNLHPIHIECTFNFTVIWMQLIHNIDLKSLLKIFTSMKFHEFSHISALIWMATINGFTILFNYSVYLNNVKSYNLNTSSKLNSTGIRSGSHFFPYQFAYKAIPIKFIGWRSLQKAAKCALPRFYYFHLPTVKELLYIHYKIFPTEK